MWVKGSFVSQSLREGAMLCDYNSLLLEGDDAHVKLCEANLSYDKSYLYKYYVQMLRCSAL